LSGLLIISLFYGYEYFMSIKFNSSATNVIFDYHLTSRFKFVNKRIKSCVIKVIKKPHLIVMCIFADEEEVRNLTEHIEDVAAINMRFNLDWKKLREIVELLDEMQTIIIRR